MDTLLRHWEMLKLIPRAPKKISTVCLRERLETHAYPVTLRSVQRDLEKLSTAFPITSDHCKPAGWSWAQNAPQFDIPGMESEAALVFKMAQLRWWLMAFGVGIEVVAPPALRQEFEALAAERGWLYAGFLNE